MYSFLWLFFFSVDSKGSNLPAELVQVIYGQALELCRQSIQPPLRKKHRYVCTCAYTLDMVWGHFYKEISIVMAILPQYCIWLILYEKCPPNWLQHSHSVDVTPKFPCPHANESRNAEVALTQWGFCIAGKFQNDRQNRWSTLALYPTEYDRG